MDMNNIEFFLFSLMFFALSSYYIYRADVCRYGMEKKLLLTTLCLFFLWVVAFKFITLDFMRLLEPKGYSMRIFFLEIPHDMLYMMPIWTIGAFTIIMATMVAIATDAANGKE